MTGKHEQQPLSISNLGRPSRRALPPYDPEFTRRFFRTVGPPLAKVFRLEVTGLENLDPDLPGILAITHNAGFWGILDVALFFHIFHNLAPDSLGTLSGMTGPNTFDLPGLGFLAPRIGLKFPTPRALDRCLAADDWVVLAPGGNTDMMRPIWQRNRVRFKQSVFVGKRRIMRDSRWFIDAALRAGVPIYPVAISGTHEMTPILYDSPTLLRWFGLQRLRRDQSLPGFPITLNHLINLAVFLATPWAGSYLAWIIFLLLNIYVDIFFMYPLWPVKIRYHVAQPILGDSYTNGTDMASKRQSQKELYDRVVATVNLHLERLDSKRIWGRSQGRDE